MHVSARLAGVQTSRSAKLRPDPRRCRHGLLGSGHFAWTERTVLVDPEGMSVPYWPWKLWQIGPLLIGLGGVWWVWLSTRQVPWVRSLALAILALVVLANGYSGCSTTTGETCGARSTRCLSVPPAWRRWLCGAAEAQRATRARQFRWRWVLSFSPMATS